jgi:hypothetical protein
MACSQLITYKFMPRLKQPEPALEMRQKIDERVSIQFKIKTKPSFLNKNTLQEMHIKGYYEY